MKTGKKSIIAVDAQMKKGDNLCLCTVYRQPHNKMENSKMYVTTIQRAINLIEALH